MYRFDAAHDGATPEAVYPPLTSKWNFTTDARPNAAASVYSPPSVAGGVVYFGSENGNMYALDASTGELKWKYTTPWNAQWSERGFLNSAPAVAGGLVYVGSLNGNVYAFDALSGAVKWSYLTRAQVESSPVISGNTVYIGSDDNHLYVLDTVTGAVKWTYPISFAPSPPAVSGGLVYVDVGCITGPVGCISGARLVALNATSGAQVWTFTCPSEPMYVRWGITISGPAVSDGVVFIGGGDGDVYALNATTGAVMWSHFVSRIEDNAEFSPPAISGGLVYIYSDDANVNALDASSGAIVWKFNVGSSISIKSYPPTVSGDILYVSSDGLKLYALNATNGASIWSGPVSTDCCALSSPVVSNGFLYLSSDVNLVVALSGQVSPSTPTNTTTSTPLTVSTVTPTTSTPLSYTSLAIAISLGVLVIAVIGYLVRKSKHRGSNSISRLRHGPSAPTEAVNAAVLTMFCRECGAKIPRSSKFCSKCGTKF